MNRLTYKFANHIYLSLGMLMIISLIISYSDLSEAISSNLITYLGTLFFIVVFFSIGSLPLLLGLYISLKYPSKTKILRILQLIFFPLIGALIVPLYFGFRGDEHWTTGLAIGLFSIVNLVLYLANEAYLFSNLKNLKKLN